MGKKEKETQTCYNCYLSGYLGLASGERRTYKKIHQHNHKENSSKEKPQTHHLCSDLPKKFKIVNKNTNNERNGKILFYPNQ